MILTPYLRAEVEKELTFWRKVQAVFQRLATDPGAAAMAQIDAEVKSLELYKGFWLEHDEGYVSRKVAELQQRLAGG
jgi:hypothetical protein